MGMLLPYWSVDQVLHESDPVERDDAPRHLHHVGSQRLNQGSLTSWGCHDCLMGVGGSELPKSMAGIH